MLIQTAYNNLPNKKSCNNGSVLYGAAVSNMSAALSQLTHVKFLGMCNYQVMRTTYNSFFNSPGDRTGVRLAQGVGNITKGYVESHRFFYASTPISTWLGVLLAYESGSEDEASTTNFSPEITINVSVLSGTPLADVGVADAGIKLDSSNSLLLASISGSQYTSGQQTTRVSFHYAESNINIPTSAPTNVNPVSPRPLYIPPTATIATTTYNVRGTIVSLNVTCEDCKLRSFTVFDLYQPELAT
jgi:hypothetical protein